MGACQTGQQSVGATGALAVHSFTECLCEENHSHVFGCRSLVACGSANTIIILSTD